MPGQGVLLDGRYRLEQHVGGGAMGQVWRAEDTVLDRTVAVKILRAELLSEPQALDRFQREAKVLAVLRHPNIVAVHDSGHCDTGDGEERAYLVMEYVEGRSLREVLNERSTLGPDEVMELVADIADALAAAHDDGIVHRDVKPANVLIRSDGGAVLADFGVARSAALSSITGTGVVIGTLAYLAPEQAKGAPPGPAADQYSLGVVAYECLAGQRPFAGDNAAEIMFKHLQDEPPPLPEKIPERIRAVVERTLRKDPAERWPSAAELAEAARDPGDDTVPQVEVTLADRPPAPPERRRPRLLAPLPAALAVLLLGGGSYTLWLKPWDGSTHHQALGIASVQPTAADPSGFASPSPKRDVSASPSRAQHRTKSPTPRATTTRAAGPGGGSTPTASAAAKATVPNVVDMTRSKAKAKITAAGLVPDVQTQPGWYVGAGTCVVYRQTPSGGAKEKKGSSVTIYASAYVTSTDGSCD